MAYFYLHCEPNDEKCRKEKDNLYCALRSLKDSYVRALLIDPIIQDYIEDILVYGLDAKCRHWVYGSIEALVYSLEIDRNDPIEPKMITEVENAFVDAVPMFIDFVCDYKISIDDVIKNVLNND